MAVKQVSYVQKCLPKQSFSSFHHYGFLQVIICLIIMLFSKPSFLTTHVSLSQSIRISMGAENEMGCINKIFKKYVFLHLINKCLILLRHFGFAVLDDQVLFEHLGNNQTTCTWHHGNPQGILQPCIGFCINIIVIFIVFWRDGGTDVL